MTFANEPDALPAALRCSAPNQRMWACACLHAHASCPGVGHLVLALYLHYFLPPYLHAACSELQSVCYGHGGCAGKLCLSFVLMTMHGARLVHVSCVFKV